MRVFTVHVRNGGDDPDGEIILVKEGFSWPAFLFGVLWALRHRLWVAAGAILLAAGVIAGTMAAFRLPLLSQGAVWLGFAMMIGTVGNDLRRRSLARGRFVETAVVVSRDREEAEWRYRGSQTPFAGASLP